jgi:hypothetical protein
MYTPQGFPFTEMSFGTFSSQCKLEQVYFNFVYQSYYEADKLYRSNHNCLRSNRTGIGKTHIESKLMQSKTLLAEEAEVKQQFCQICYEIRRMNAIIDLPNVILKPS